MSRPYLPAGTTVWARPITFIQRNSCSRILREDVYLSEIQYDTFPDGSIRTDLALYTFPTPIDGVTGFNYRISDVEDK